MISKDIKIIKMKLKEKKKETKIDIKIITKKIMIENQMIEITKMTEIHKEEMIIIIDKL